MNTSQLMIGQYKLVRFVFRKSTYNNNYRCAMCLTRVQCQCLLWVSLLYGDNVMSERITPLNVYYPLQRIIIYDISFLYVYLFVRACSCTLPLRSVFSCSTRWQGWLSKCTYCATSTRAARCAWCVVPPGDTQDYVSQQDIFPTESQLEACHASRSDNNKQGEEN